MKINIYPVDPRYGGEYMNACVKPASNDIPDWYKKSNSYVGDPSDKMYQPKRMSIKKCIPVLEYMTTGLNLYLPFSIFVEGRYPERDIYTNVEHDGLAKMGHHSIDQAQLFPLPDSYDIQPHKIDFPWMIETPKGYSSIYVQPQNELYDTLLFPRGLVNTDNYKNQVNFPFFLKKDFTGTIDAGTHFMSVFFIKREKEEFVFNEFEKGREKILQAKSMVQNWGRHFYKNTRF